MKEQYLCNYYENSGNILSEEERLSSLSEELNLSIVVPAFNEESDISNLLECLDRQNINQKYELIVVDNGGSDQTSEIVRSFRFTSGNQIFVVNEPKKGAGRARKAGVDEIIRRVLERDGDTPKRHYIILTDADTQPGNAWLSSMHEQMSLSPQSILVSGNYHASPKIDEMIEREIGIKNYFLSFSTVSELLDLAVGQRRMRGPNSGFEIECYAKAGGFRQPLDEHGNTAPRECFDFIGKVRETGLPIEHFGYSVITSQRRKLFELINDLSTYDVVDGDSGRFLSTRSSEGELLNYALKMIPPSRWLAYQEKILCRIVINSLLNPLSSASIQNTQNILSLVFWAELVRDASILEVESLNEKWATRIARELLSRVTL